MNKKLMFLAPLALVFAGMSLTNVNNSIKTSATNSEFNNLPNAGEVSNDSYFTNAWETTVGARRISDRGVIVVDMAGWGYRGKIPSRKFDLTSFNFSLDLSNLPYRGAMMVMIGSNEGTYCIDTSNKIAIDIVKHSSDPTIFQVTVDTGTASHAVSISDWQDGKGWSDDGAYKGRTVTAEDGVINFSIKKTNFETSTITCNDQVVNVSNEDLYAQCSESSEGYVAIGNYGGSGQYSYIINSIGDASDEVYFSTGAFGTVKDGIVKLDEYNYETINTTDLMAAKLEYDALPYSSLYSWDKNYFSSTYTELGVKINNAVEAAGNTIQLDILEQKINDLDSLIEGGLETEEKIDNAISLCSTINEKIIAIEDLELNQGEATRFSDLCGTFEGFFNAVTDAAKTYYENAVKALEDCIGTGIDSGLVYAEALKLKGQIPTKYCVYFTEEEMQTLDNRATKALEIADKSTTLTHANWKQANDAKVVTTKDNTLDVVSYGNCMDLSDPMETSGLYLQQSLNVLDFSVTLNFASIPQETGHWTTVGFMQNPDMWVYSSASGKEVTDNQGIYFIISRVSNTLLQVESHLCTMSSSNFFDTTLTQMINIPYQEDVVLSFTTETREVAGVSDTYFNIKFNDIGLDQENITARKIKTVIPSVEGKQKGYFFVATSGYSKNNPAVIQIKDINGFSPLAESLEKIKTDHEAPTSTSTKSTFVYGSEAGKATFNVDLHGEELVSLTCDGNALTTDDYELSDTKLVIKNSYCRTLSVGEHTVTLTTAGGSISWTINVVSNGEDPTPTPDPTPSKGGCGSSVIASSALLAITSLSALLIIAKKKKEY